MNAARALRVARTRAGLSQTELARRAGVPIQSVNRIERATVIPRVDTLQRLLAAAGATLTIERRRGGGIDREPIRRLLHVSPRSRLDPSLIGAIHELCRRRVRFLVVGDAAARLHGAPVDVSRLGVVVSGVRVNLSKLRRARESPAVSDVSVRLAAPDAALWRRAAELPWLPMPKVRVLDRWLDAPTGYLAAIEDLMTSAPPERRELLRAVQEEIDLLQRGYRIYRYPEGRLPKLPPPRRRPRRHPRSTHQS
jgi:transcriptional regulator with XRE-family HTH domain